MTRTLPKFVTLAVLIGVVLFAAPAGVALAQGRRGKKTKRKKGSTSNRATLVLTSGKKRLVTIREATYKLIKFREKGASGTQEIKAERVREIRYRSAPPAYSSGRSQMRAGQYSKAAESFTKALGKTDSGSGPWLYAAYWLGKAQLLNKKFDEAGSAFKRVREKGPECFLLPAATYGLGQAEAGASAYTKATATFSKLDDGFGTYWRALCQIGIGDAYLLQKKGTPARKAYKMAESRGARFPEIRQRALVGVGKSYVLSKSWAKALSEFESIITTAGADPVVAGNAWVGKGDCLMAKAQEKGSGDGAYKSLLKEALIAYLTCTVRFAGIPEAYPKALFQAGAIYEKLGKAKQAVYQRNELKTRCPNTRWAKKLKK
jgi:TolA-binding protein